MTLTHIILLIIIILFMSFIKPPIIIIIISLTLVLVLPLVMIKAGPGRKGKTGFAEIGNYGRVTLQPLPGATLDVTPGTAHPFASRPPLPPGAG